MRYLGIAFLGIIFLLFGCQSNTDSNSAKSEQDIGYTKLHNQKLNQQPANRAKEILAKHHDLNKVYAVNTKKDIIVAIDPEQHKRFQLSAMKKKYKKELKKVLPDYNVRLTTDKKIIFELNKLETTIKDKHLSEKEIKKRLKQLKKLMIEKT